MGGTHWRTCATRRARERRPPPGARWIAAASNAGIANTGAHARFLNRPPGVLPAPGQVPMRAGLVYLPRPPVDPFVGRDDALQALHAALSAEGAGVVSQAV